MNQTAFFYNRVLVGIHFRVMNPDSAVFYLMIKRPQANS